MKKENIFVISGYYGFNNSGDDAILKAIVNDFKTVDSNINIFALSKDPLSTEKNYSINAIDRFSFIKVLKAIYKSDAFLSGGGSLLQDVTSTRSIIYYLTLIYFAKLFKKPVMVYANGIGPINKKINRYLTKHILNKVDLISLRDDNSKKTVEELGVENKRVYVTADPVFSLQPTSIDKVNDILKNEDIPIDKPLIGIAIRDWKNSKEIIEVVSKTIDYIKQSYDVNVILIPMHYPEDTNISEEVIAHCSTKAYLLKEKYPVEDIMGIISKLELIIAMRLHSLIYAATQAVPMVGIVYDPKVEGFLDSIGLDTKCSVENLDMIDLCKTIDRVLNNKAEIKSNLINIKNSFMEKSNENIKMALSLLRKR